MRLTTARFKHGGKKAKAGADAPSVKGFAWIVGNLAQGRDISSKVTLRHEGRCGRCGRSLTTPASIDTGIGPVCAAAMGIDWDTVENAEQEFDALRYMTAGKAFLTATSLKTGTSFTYKIELANPREGDTHRLFFVKVLNGPDNRHNYAYLGTLWVGGAEPFEDPELAEALEDARRAPSKTYEGRRQEARWAAERAAELAESTQAEASVAEVREAMKETVGYPPKCWYLDKQTNDAINSGVRQGLLFRPSTTQVEWTEAGAAAAHECEGGDPSYCWCNDGEAFAS